jgi:antitoxin component YwqK of YwqJK toxin-antitoxin module
MRYFFIILLLITTKAFSQYNNYIIGVKGDTLNIVDKKGLKQGKWVVKYEELRGERGYEEEGVYTNNQKEGTWRRYSLEGDLIAVENFRWGNKDGISQYYNKVGELIREESWRAINPDKQYDTLDVEDIDHLGNYKRVIVKNEGAGVKHGIWKYYDPASGMIVKTEVYTVGKLETSDKPAVEATDTTAGKKTAKPKEVLEFEKKNAGKKSIKVRDGSTL